MTLILQLDPHRFRGRVLLPSILMLRHCSHENKRTSDDKNKVQYLKKSFLLQFSILIYPFRGWERGNRDRGSNLTPPSPFCASNIVAARVLEHGFLFCLSLTPFFLLHRRGKSKSGDYFRLLDPLNCDSWGRVRREGPGGCLPPGAWVGI